MIHIGKAARYLRDRLGITQREVAERLGISYVHLSNIENNKVLPSASILESYKSIWGIDLYVLGWCLNGDADRLPSQFTAPVRELTKAWKSQIELMLRRKDSSDDSHQTT